MKLRALAVFLGVSAAAVNGLAEPRPSDEDIFGGAGGPTQPAAATTDSSTTKPAAGTQAPPQDGSALVKQATSADSGSAGASATAPASRTKADQRSVVEGSDGARDAQVLGPSEPNPMFTEEAAPEDPLKIGGQVYLRMQSTAAEGQRFQDYSFSSPSMLDVYMDARPNDRVRAFARGRMLYDPTLPTSAGGDNTLSPLSASGSTSGTPSLSSLFQSQTRDPKAYLDQLWINFDIAHHLFVTAGKQHVRWGTGHFWAPTDYLHLRPRNPLDVFDARTGTSMVKLHLPIESQQWNFYAYGITENYTATQSLGTLAGALRAEFVFGTTEVALGMLSRQYEKPKYAFDLSTGIYDFDLYGELALRYRDGIDRVAYAGSAVVPVETAGASAATRLNQVIDTLYPLYRDTGIAPQVVGGITYSRKYNDNDTFTIGAEYFYNALGYESPSAYPGLVLPHSRTLSDAANFFYLGKHYGAAYLTFPAPYSLDTHTFTLSTIGNLSDKSFITRFDYSLVVLTHLRFEAFVSGRYGNENGEFRFGIRQLSLGSFTFSRAPAIGDCGIGLRVAI